MGDHPDSSAEKKRFSLESESALSNNSGMFPDNRQTMELKSIRASVGDIITYAADRQLKVFSP